VILDLNPWERYVREYIFTSCFTVEMEARASFGVDVLAACTNRDIIGNSEQRDQSAQFLGEQIYIKS